MLQLAFLSLFVVSSSAGETTDSNKRTSYKSHVSLSSHRKLLKKAIPFKFANGFPAFGDKDPVLQLHPDAKKQDLLLNEDTGLETIIVNDKSKGYTWLLNLKTKMAMVADLPLSGGNHESAVISYEDDDGNMVSVAAIPHYETALEQGVGEGGGTPGSEVSMIELTTGKTKTLMVPPNPFGSSKPHDSTFVDKSSLLITGQLSNGLVLYKGINSFAPTVQSFVLPEPCNTPHLVFMIPKTSLAVTGCRCNNPGQNDDNCQSAVSILDVETGKMKSLNAPYGAEGITTTAGGKIWVGGLRATENQVAIYGPPEGEDPTLDNIEFLEYLQVPKPIRLAYDDKTNTVGIVPLVSTDSSVLAEQIEDDSNFYLFDASSHELLSKSYLATDRGRVNSEALMAIGNGIYITGGFDTATVVVVDTTDTSLPEVIATIYLPHCTLPRSIFANPTELPSTQDAKDKGLTGSNNWSGGYCGATLRNGYDTRFTVTDGFNYSPVAPGWATGSVEEGNLPSSRSVEEGNLPSSGISNSNHLLSVGLVFTILLAITMQ